MHELWQMGLVVRQKNFGYWALSYHLERSCKLVETICQTEWCLCVNMPQNVLNMYIITLQSGGL